MPYIKHGSRYQKVTTEQLVASRYIPKNATRITSDSQVIDRDESDLGVVYVYPKQTPKGVMFGAIGYIGNSAKSAFHYLYRTDTELDRKITEFFTGLRQHRELVAKRRADQYAGHIFKPGDIVTNSWGYDQTNVDWYIVKRTTKNFVYLKPVCGQLVSEESEGFSPMAGVESLRLDADLKPIEGDGPETKHAASGDNVTMKHGCGSKWTGDKKYSSWYA